MDAGMERSEAMKHSMKQKSRYALLTLAVMNWIAMPVWAADSPAGGASSASTRDINVEAERAKEAAKYESQSTTIITKEDIAAKQAKNLEDIIFSETGVTRTVDSMGRVGISIRGADPRHTLMLIDGQPVMGSESKYMGGSDEAMRIGTENIERIEIIRGAATAKYGPDAIGGVINIITKAPTNTPSIEINGEARYHNHEGTSESNTWPSNFYLRADSGKVGNAKFSIFGSKRDIMPVYSNERSYTKGVTSYGEDFRPSLRYYGDVKNIGATGEIDLDKNNKISFRVMSEKEDMERRNKSAKTAIDALFEPMQIFSRNVDRDTYSFSYTGKDRTNDWKIDVNYGKMKETDLTKTAYFGKGFSDYTGKNSLVSVDWLEHKQLDVNATMNTQVDDKHLLSYGIGYTDERADGTRLKNAPKKWTKSIDPWDYDKNLWVNTSGGTVNEPDSSVHDYLLEQTEDGLVWNRNQEYYGIEGKLPTGWLEENEVSTLYTKYIHSGDSEALSKLETFGKILYAQNPNATVVATQGYAALARQYYALLAGSTSADNEYYYQNITYNGKYYKEIFDERKNRVSGGEARIQRRHAFFGDTWQVDDDTIITPVLRVDNSDLFNNHVTFNVGMTHNINGNAHRRFKFNAGTGYAEPGMGELYYNWEMYGSAGGSRYGWYWLGNPNLKPEKSVNFDISVEGEQGKTYAKATVFSNTINDYMTSYFVGQLIDFNQYSAATGSSSASVINADRIYSFKNIGKAQITGIEAEVQQRFDNHWSTKLGYAWLHAINKSDPDMPRQLLDRPQHKVDISFNYQDAKTGWKAALWGDYYINMLDSNSISTIFTSADIDENGNWKKKDANYRKKTFGIWNFMLEKQISPEAKVYFGIDNLFNHRDDDRAYQDRTYRIGANFKLGGSSNKPKVATTTKEANGENTADEQQTVLTPADTASGYDVVTTKDGTKNIENNSDWFLNRPSDKDVGRKAGDIDVIGDYRMRSNMYGGKESSGVRELVMTDSTGKLVTGSNDDGAVENQKNAPGHGFEQRLRLGADVQLADNTNLVVLGSSGDTIDTKYSKSNYRGLHDIRLDKITVNQKLDKWDITAGRIAEDMGITGYWFGQTYDGIRAAWTDSNTQVRLGYGDFSKSTGIYNSAYTHSEKATFYRAPTYAELMGKNGVTYPDGVNYENSQVDYYSKYYSAGGILHKNASGKWVTSDGTLESKITDVTLKTQIADARLQVLSELNEIRKNIGTLNQSSSSNYVGRLWYNETFQNEMYDEYPADKTGYYWTPEGVIDDVYNFYGNVTDSSGSTRNVNFFNAWLYDGVDGDLNADALQYYDPDWEEDVDWDGGNVFKLRMLGYDIKSISWSEALATDGKDKIYAYLNSIADAIEANYAKLNSTVTYTDSKGNEITKDEAIDSLYASFISTARSSVMNPIGYDPTDGVPVPLDGLAKIIKTEGTLIKRDIIPSIDRASFIQLRQKLGKDLGLTAWYLRSSGDKFRKTGYNEDMSTYEQRMDVANVFGLGAEWRLGASRLSFDWGVNRSETGRYFNGGRDEYGRYTGGGSNPTFWVLRADLGHADTNVPGSWSAFADYKYFRHGSFFGGNGTESLPDRYLDGIRSFTIGAGYVPTRNLLLEAFYTFGAKSTQRRDTLHGTQNFSLGDYARIQATYKF